MTERPKTCREHPHRPDYASDLAWLEACAAYLDRRWPRRVEQRHHRAIEFRVLDELASRRKTVERLRELIVRDRLDAFEEYELERLCEAYVEHGRQERDEIVIDIEPDDEPEPDPLEILTARVKANRKKKKKEKK